MSCLSHLDPVPGTRKCSKRQVASAAVVVKTGPALLASPLFNRKRPDVVTTTGWLAPVIWEGTFDRQVLEDYYGAQNLTVGLAVLAPGR